jgi:hypothetical protein
MTTGRCRLCFIDGPIEPDAEHVYRCPDHAACAERARMIADPVPPPGTLPPDDEERLKRRLASAWVERNMGTIGRAIIGHYEH